MADQNSQSADSLWRSTAEPLQDFAALSVDVETDLLIVGAGYTGLSTALHVVDAIKDIVVVDQAGAVQAEMVARFTPNGNQILLS